MHLKPFILTLEDCLPYPLPPSTVLVQRNKDLLCSRVLNYKETEIQKATNLDQAGITDHLFLYPFNPAITMQKRPYNEQLKLNGSSINQKVRRQS